MWSWYKQYNVLEEVSQNTQKKKKKKHDAKLTLSQLVLYFHLVLDLI